MEHFSDQFIKASKSRSSYVLGIDPNFNLMPDFLKPRTTDAAAVKDAL